MADPVIDRVVEGTDALEMVSNADLLNTYRDALRGKETDYARRLALPEDYGPQFEQNIATLETQIERLRQIVDIYDEKAREEAEAIAPPPEDVPGDGLGEPPAEEEDDGDDPS